ncbi:DUF5723 family protein [Bacteroides sp. 224]|uniref:DUF5723 family protein n=1 Tax=Bacteroides sp. 224 TaxID=2302936 RepID=UPI0013D6BCB0|nr:DUF5723 family protein [Bacteroides sp. 224]NDV66377.1 hypothetical protein [Bacteroides sp. 224]
MRKRNVPRFIKLMGVLGILSMIPMSGFAQYLRTSYFMDGVSSRMWLNPAMRPTHGFVDIPVVGALNVSASSNALGVKDVVDLFDSDEDFYKNDKLYNRLKNSNRLNVNVNTDIFSLGFYKGKGFWTVNLGLRSDINASIPKTMFEYAREFDNEDWMNGFMGADYLMENQTLNANVYTEIGVGYSRSIGDKLVVGGKAKVLLGLANIDMSIDKLHIKENGKSSEINTHGRLKVAMKGLSVEEEYDSEIGSDVVDDVDFDKFGLAGYGMAFDLGATFKPIENLTLSASVLDLGFISWSKNSVTTATADNEIYYDYGDTFKSLFNGDMIDFSLPKYEIDDESKSYKTTLASTMVLGAEYAFLNNKLSAGVLSTTRFSKPKTISELTFSANYRPKSWLATTLSYSVIQSEMKTFGLAVKVGPLFIGTDYMFFGDSSDSKSVNAYLGLSIPLGKGKN